MAQNFIAGKRYPRGMRLSMSINGGGEKLSCSYYDLGKVIQNSSMEEYNKKITQIKKMGNFG